MREVDPYKLHKLTDVSPRFLQELEMWLGQQEFQKRNQVQNLGSGYDLVEEEGSPLTKRTTLNFVGTNVTASDDAVNGVTKVEVSTPADAAYNSYTPTLKATTTNPTNWTGSSKYIQIGAFVHWYGNVTASASPTVGSGTWYLDLPVTGLTGQDARGSGWLEVFGVPFTFYGLWVRNVTGVSQVEFLYPATWPGGSEKILGSGVGYTPGAGDTMRWNITYPAA